MKEIERESLWNNDEISKRSIHNVDNGNDRKIKKIFPNELTAR